MTASFAARVRLGFLLAAVILPAGGLVASEAEEILQAAGVQGGLVVHVGCGDARLTAALGAGDHYVVHGLDPHEENVQEARRHADDLGLDGRVLVEQLQGDRLPYVDNLVNLLVSDDLGAIPAAEVMRVLAPGGVAYVKKDKDDAWTKTVKPWPAEIDQWTHYLHDADGNAVAHDAVVGPPRQIQWKAGPTWARHHDTLASTSALVWAAGRVFYIIDEGPPSLMHYPPKWRLAARDAFNGVLLWKRPIGSWVDPLRGFRSGPPQLPRRLVAVGDRVYATLGLTAPVAALDAATGEVVKTFAGTDGTDEILFCRGILLLATVDFESQVAAEEAYRRGTAPPPESPKAILALEADTGRLLWRKAGAEMAALRPMTLAAAADRALFQCGDDVCCLELETGRDLWRHRGQPSPQKPAAKPAKKRPKQAPTAASYYAPTLVACAADGVVLWASGSRLAALSLENGEVLWTRPCQPGFRAPTDVFVADGLVWFDHYPTSGLDPRTGEVRRTLRLDPETLVTPGHHHRCYRNKATDRFVIDGKRGMEFFDLAADGHSRNNWARGGCQYGIMPSGGLVYLPPNACCCYAGVLLHGFYALAPESRGPHQALRAADENRLERGPAFGKLDGARPASSSAPAAAPVPQWRTYRRDVTRSGATPTPLPTSLQTIWQSPLGGKLTPPVIADAILVVSSVEQHRITALNAETGEKVWSFSPGGRVDSPPTIHRGLVLFGANDGWVYSLRAADGRLVWRFRAAHEDRRIVVDNRLESVWPVPGSVLVLDDVAYVAAGRSSYLDGGIYLYGLEPETGRKLHEARVAIPHQEDESLAFVMAGVRADVLVSDGKYVYLKHFKFDRQLVRQKEMGRHLLSDSGLADDGWFYRTFWRLGYGDSYDFPNSYTKHDMRVPFGQLLAFDDRRVCGLQTFFSPRIVTAMADQSGRGCMLFGDPNTPLTPDARTSPDSDYPPGKMQRRDAPVDHQWTANLPFQARAMVLAGETLFVAGWPDVADPADPHAAPEGRKGGTLWTFSTIDGTKLAERELDAPPVFDGMAAAGGRLYLSTTGGVVCLGGPTGR